MKQLIQVGVLGAGLIFALIASYLVYFEADETVKSNDKGVAVYVAEADQLQAVTFATDDKTVVLTRKNDAGGDWLEVEVTTRTEVAPEPEPVVEESDDTDGSDATDASDTTDGSDATDDTDAGWTPPEPTIVEEVERFVGNSAAEDLWASFAPFKADRTLTPEEGLDMGFGEPFATLTVQRKSGNPVEVVFGGPTYGERARYARSGDKVYLVKKRTLTTLTSTEKLKERSLHPLQLADVESVTITRGDQRQAFVHKNPDDRAKRFWAPQATPDTRNEEATRWLPSLVRMGVQAYPAEVPDGLTTSFSAEVVGEGKTWAIEVLSDGAESPTWYAKTAYNRGTVELTPSQAAEIVADLEAVLSPPEAPPE